ncbi:20S-pre-rRNA D-site endonuclease NOB1 [Diplocarpon rosae]|nr:20S-pre-rRNA D-site endonuclease NOB1 [Diplocarpon rosae]
MATNVPKPVHSIVLDSGPIIKNDPHISTILAQAENIYTIPAVIDEIRDAATRARLEMSLLPFLKLRSPRPGSVKHVMDFARKTGDLEVLSRPDIHVMALTFELAEERENDINGNPVKDEAASAVQKREDESSRSKEEAPAPVSVRESRGAWGTAIPIATVDSEAQSIDQVLAATHISAPEVQAPEPVVEAALPTEVGKPTSQPEPIAVPSASGVQPLEGEADQSTNPTLPEPPVEEALESDSEDSDGEGWITPSNLKKHQARDASGTSGRVAALKSIQVAVITSDFAMQNVILRMNLNLLSPSLQRIRQIKTWVLRCHACFNITKDMEKQFCGKCGKDTLMRTSCTTDKNGKIRVHLKKNMQWNTRGNVYSIPKPVAGTSNGKLVQGGGKGGWGQNLILAEDQKEYIQAMTGRRRNKEKDLMDEDYLPGLLSGDRGRPGSRPRVGAGRNVNSKKRY